MSKNSETHAVCNKHNIGGKSVCCECSGKTDCSDTPEASEVGKTFAEMQKEMAREEAVWSSQCNNIKVVPLSTVDTLTETIIHNTLAAMERVVEKEKQRVCMSDDESDDYIIDVETLKARLQELKETPWTT